MVSEIPGKYSYSENINVFFRDMENEVRHLSSLYSTQGELSALGWDSNTSGILGLEVVRAGAMSHYKLRSASEIPPSSGLRQQTL